MKNTRNTSLRTHTLAIAGSLLLGLPLALTACSTPADSTGPAPTEQQDEAGQSAHLTLTGGWAKAAEGMSGVFGTLENHSETDIQVVGATSDVADLVELHETVTSGSTATMREAEGGFEIAAGSSYELEPGGDHIMLMEMPNELLPGDEVPITLELASGDTVELTVLVKDFAGAEENYEGGDHDEGHDHNEGHEHGEDHAEH